MRRIGEAFYGRQRAYGAALASSDDQLLAAVLQRNVFAGAPAAAGARGLAAYVRAADRMLEAQQGLERGELLFPDPEQLTGS
jgi:cytochrome b pre-mRNA-processing protein 3